MSGELFGVTMCTIFFFTVSIPANPRPVAFAAAAAAAASAVAPAAVADSAIASAADAAAAAAATATAATAAAATAAAAAAAAAGAATWRMITAALGITTAVDIFKHDSCLKSIEQHFFTAVSGCFFVFSCERVLF